MAKNKKVRFVPVFKTVILKNPQPLFPIDYEKVYGEDNVWYQDEPIFDNLGNYIETKINQFVATRQLVRMYAVKKKAKCNSKFENRPLFNLKGNDEDEKK